MKRIITTLFSLLLCGWISAAFAETDLLSVYKTARDTDPEYRAAVAQRDASLEALPQARALLLPQAGLTGEAGYSQREIFAASSPFAQDENFLSYSARLEVRQALFSADAWAGYGAAKIAGIRAELALGQAEYALMIRAADAYFTFLAAEEDLEFAQSEQAATAKQLEQNQQRYEVGLIAITDVQETQARYDLVSAQLITAEQQLANAQDTLAQIIGQREESLPDLRAKLPLNSPDPDDVDAWVKTAHEKNLRVLDARAFVEQSKRLTTQSKSGHLPTLDAVASSGYQDNSETSFGSKALENRIALQLNVPLFSGGSTSSKVRQRVYEQETSKQQLEQTLREVERETRANFRGVISSISRVGAFAQAVKSNQTALKATEAGYEVGNRTPVDILNARSALFRAQRDYARSRYEYVLQQLRLQQVAGTLKAEDLFAVNALLEGSLVPVQ